MKKKVAASQHECEDPMLAQFLDLLADILLAPATRSDLSSDALDDLSPPRPTTEPTAAGNPGRD